MFYWRKMIQIHVKSPIKQTLCKLGLGQNRERLAELEAPPKDSPAAGPGVFSITQMVSDIVDIYIYIYIY
jgi:hypothetical protein